MSKILVVDDEPAVYEIIKAALASEGHVPRYAPNGQDGLTLLAEERVDLVIVDLTIPAMNGLELLDQLRRMQRNLRLLIMTEHPAPEAVIGALRKRVCDFLAKPFTAEELRAAVRNALAGYPVNAIEVVSASPEWVELRLLCLVT